VFTKFEYLILNHPGTRGLAREWPTSRYGPRPAKQVSGPVCIENLIRFDCVAESHNVSANGRADIPLAERGCLALQVEEPA
jgi:hypothetical protein